MFACVSTMSILGSFRQTDDACAQIALWKHAQGPATRTTAASLTCGQSARSTCADASGMIVSKPLLHFTIVLCFHARKQHAKYWLCFSKAASIDPLIPYIFPAFEPFAIFHRFGCVRMPSLVNRWFRISQGMSHHLRGSDRHSC